MSDRGPERDVLLPKVRYFLVTQPRVNFRHLPEKCEVVPWFSGKVNLNVVPSFSKIVNRHYVVVLGKIHSLTVILWKCKQYNRPKKSPAILSFSEERIWRVFIQILSIPGKTVAVPYFFKEIQLIVLPFFPAMLWNRFSLKKLVHSCGVKKSEQYWYKYVN